MEKRDLFLLGLLFTGAAVWLGPELIKKFEEEVLGQKTPDRPLAELIHKDTPSRNDDLVVSQP